MKGDVIMLDVNTMKEILNYAMEQVKNNKGVSLSVSFYSSGSVTVNIYGVDDDED